MIEPDLFRKIAGHWLSGVAVVTSVDENSQFVGMTMSAVSSLSLDPPQFLACMDHRATTLKAIRATGHFCINFLAEDQEHLSNLFAQRAETDKFAEVSYQIGKLGSPILHGTVAYVECELAEIVQGGDHGIVIGNAITGSTPGGFPLGYFSGSYRKIER